MKFTQEHARKIVKKLKGKIEPHKRHDQAVIRHDGHIVAQYGIRRASKEVPHDYLPEQLGISPHQTSRLASCTLDKDQYFNLLRKQENDADPHLRNGKQ